MLAVAGTFSLLVERSVASASLAWLSVSVAAWFAGRQLRSVCRPERNYGPAISRSR
jgi:hypothetical protein